MAVPIKFHLVIRDRDGANRTACPRRPTIGYPHATKKGADFRSKLIRRDNKEDIENERDFVEMQEYEIAE